MVKIVDGNTILSTWDSNNSNWVIDGNGNIKMNSNLESFNYIVAPYPNKDFAFTGTFSMPSDDDGIGFVYDFQDDNNYKMFIYQGGGLPYGNPRSSVRVFHVIDGSRSVYLSDNGSPYWQIGVPVKISFEILGDSITVYFDNNLALKYSETNLHYGRFGFVTYSQIATISSIKQVETLSNRFSAKYKLYGVNSSEIGTSIEIKQYEDSEKDTEIKIRSPKDYDVVTSMDVMYRGNSDILTEIQPVGYNSIETEIEVPPHNRMYALYEVQQPPIVTDVFNPTQDAFTREESSFQSINYGRNSSMVVGRSKDDIWRSFVQFDLSSINHSYILKESHLRLYYKGVTPTNLKLEILNADSAWQEDSITNLNKPNPIDLISSDFTIDTKKGYIEFDVLDIVKSWVALEKLNNGFVIRLSNETDYGQTTFHTRETALPPELIVKYFDSRIFSQGRSQHLAEIFAYMRRYSDKLTEITVDSVYSFEKIDTEIYVHRVEVPIPNDISTEITASKPYIYTEIIATIHKDDEVFVEIGARLPQESRKNVEIIVSRPYALAEIYVRHQSEIETEVVSRAYRESTADVEITVSRPQIYVEITPVIHDTSETDIEIAVTRPSLDVEITVPINGFSQIFTEIEANEFWTSIVPVEIYITKQNIPIEVNARVGRNNDLYTLIHVSIPKVEVEVEVKHKNDIWVEIEPNIKSDIPTEISVTKPYIEVSITAQAYDDSNVDTEIFVRYISDVDTIIDAKLISQVDTEIDIIALVQVAVEISVTKRKVNVEIVIPTWIDHDILTELEPRILMVDNIYTVIQVGSKGGAYAFII